jgi:hypothetical protein
LGRIGDPRGRLGPGETGASADDVRAGLTRLPLIASWQGTGGDAARASLDKLSAYLAAHGEEMARVSSATRASADEIGRSRVDRRRRTDGH